MAWELEQLTQETQRVYGLIGYPLHHSISPQIHAWFFEALGKDERYDTLEIAPDKLAETMPLMREKFAGFNVTIPHKQTIIPLLDGLSERAAWYNAVNTVVNEGGKLMGHNTDGLGFLFALARAGISLAGKRVLLIGAGGVASVMAHECAAAGAELYVYSLVGADKLAQTVRDHVNGAQVHVLSELNGNYQVILNGSPVGMWPKFETMPVSKELLVQAEAVFDTIYNPIATKLVAAARSQGKPAQSGIEMLVGQAAGSQELWQGLKLSPDLVAQVCELASNEIISHYPVNIVLTGFMGSGKSTVGALLAQATGKPFIDLDQRIVEQAGMEITEIFERYGEAHFRELESKALTEALAEKGAIIATGGGILTREQNIMSIRGTPCYNIFLDVTLETAAQRVGAAVDRPNFQGGIEKVRERYQARQPVYQAAADLIVPVERPALEVAETILNLLGIRRNQA